MEVRELCDRHGYPDLLRDALLEMIEVAGRCVPGLHSILLSGSLSTGDFLWRERPDQGAGPAVELLSDIDGFVFADLQDSDPRALAAGMREIEARTHSTLFHIDLSLSPTSALQRLAASYQMAESRQAGFVLTGADIREHFPEHFDPAASRQAFLVNLWKPIPTWKNRDGEGEMHFALAASRLMMDIATLALSEAGTCLPGHQARAREFLAHHPWSQDPVLGDALEVAAEARRHPPGDASRLEALLVPAVNRLVEKIDGLGPPTATPGPALVRRLEAWLPTRTLRRRLGEVRTLLHRPSRPDRDLLWLLSRKEAIAGACLLRWLAWLSEGGEGSPPRETLSLLSRFGREQELSGDDALCHQRAVKAYQQAWREYSPSAQ